MSLKQKLFAWRAQQSGSPLQIVWNLFMTYVRELRRLSDEIYRGADPRKKQK